MVRSQKGIAHLEGRATLDSTPELLTQLKPLIAAGLKEVTFHEISEVDSAALGLILSCRREAAKQGHTLKFTDLPANLVALAALYGVSDLISQ
ncbi:MAG: STAS domain-containing protein [Thiobacillaceae bacterium]